MALDDRGKVIVGKKFSCKQLLVYTANLQSSLIGMEVCSGRISSGQHYALEATMHGSSQPSL